MADTDQALEIRTLETGERTVIDIGGEIDVHTCSELESAVREAYGAGATGVVLDVADVAFIDSSGLRSLIALQREAGERGGSLELRSASRPVVRLLEVTGLSGMFPIIE
jgi:anti-sigma B factor antagonist